MSQDLSGQVVVVAGAGSGMGRATALAAAAAGARLVLAARSERALAELQLAITGAGGSAIAVPTDATDRAAVERLVAAARDAYGRVDVLINSVGTNIKRRTLDELTDESWSQMLGSNLTAAFNLTQAIVPLFRQQGGGLLIHISSVAAKKPDRSGVAYQATKAGVAALAYATAEEERANGIRVSVLFPGLTDTPLVLQRPTPTPPDVLARALQPEDIAAACLFVMQLPRRVQIPELVLLPSEL
jgi:NADP-dependent 3-hydroxy acid dehydrogenase YdfG